MANDKNKIYEQIYFLWKGESEKHNESIDWYCEKYHVNVEDFRRWYKGISKSVKEIQVIGRPGSTPSTDAAAQSELKTESAESDIRSHQEAEARIVITTSDAVKKPQPAIASLTVNCGNGLHITRKGMNYDEFLTFCPKPEGLMLAHKCDMSQLPEGAIKIKTEIRKVFDQISLVIEHDFELVTYRTKEGKIETAYFPFAEDKQAHIYKEMMPGTHITAGMLSHLAFDCHQMSTPVNRELTRFSDLSLKTCRQNGINARRCLQRFFQEVIKGRTDYANLLPMTIGIV